MSGLSSQYLPHLSSIVEQYDAYIIDQWGVLHNGTRPYDGTPKVLDALSDMKKTMVLLTNSGRRSSNNAAQLKEMGFDLKRFKAIVSSGEAAYTHLKNKKEEPFKSWGKKCFLIARDHDVEPVEGLDLDLCEDVDEADFIFLSWLENEPWRIEAYKSQIAKAVKRQTPLLCCNPDRYSPTAAGLIPTPGTFAQMYQDLGGPVIYIGKPYSPIYDLCLQHISETGSVDRSRILCIGDSLEHDIAGAANMGLRSVFILNGIHQREFDGTYKAYGSEAKLKSLCDMHKATPNYVMDFLNW